MKNTTFPTAFYGKFAKKCWKEIWHSETHEESWRVYASSIFKYRVKNAPLWKERFASYVFNMALEKKNLKISTLTISVFHNFSIFFLRQFHFSHQSVVVSSSWFIYMVNWYCIIDKLCNCVQFVRPNCCIVLRIKLLVCSSN